MQKGQGCINNSESDDLMSATNCDADKEYMKKRIELLEEVEDMGTAYIVSITLTSMVMFGLLIIGTMKVKHAFQID